MNIKKVHSLFLLMLTASITVSGADKKKSNQFPVDPFIGTAEHGHTFPGATMPFGMVQISPDNGTNGWDWCSGYHYTDSVIVGFSHTHLSGTGIGDLADISFMPTDKKVELTGLKEYHNRKAPWRSSFSHENEKATPGFYSVFLDDPKVKASFTATPRTAFHQYDFEKGAAQYIVIDLNFAINWDKPIFTSLQIINDSTVVGCRKSKGWANDQHIYFVARFNKPIKSYRLADAKTNTYKEGKLIESSGVRAQLEFPSNQSTLKVQVALSTVSEQNAIKNLLAEQKGWNFASAQTKAKAEWDKSLGMINIDQSEAVRSKIFYTALYHSFMCPNLQSDVDGSYLGSDKEVRKVKSGNNYSTLSLWDVFRAWSPLMTILRPDLVNDMVNSMLDFYDQTGLLPVWALAGNETNCMTGNHAVSIIAEAYAKGIRGFDAQKAYRAMKVTMESDIRGLESYKKYGFVAYDKHDQGVTITLEYAYNDYCVAQMAKMLGNTVDYEKYLKRSQNYKHLFDPVTGFFRGKNSQTGEFRPGFDPRFSKHEGDNDYTEGNAWQHSWFVPHQVDSLIEMLGGNDPFVCKLDSLFTISSEITGSEKSNDISGLIGQYAHGNEPSHHIAFLYNYAGAPQKAQLQTRAILDSLYTDKPDGLCGNDDAGQMSAWYVMASMGLYAVSPVDATYQLVTPAFEFVEIKLPKEKKMTIVAKGAKKNPCFKTVYLNGKKLNRSFITHQELMAGGELRYEI